MPGWCEGSTKGKGDHRANKYSIEENCWQDWGGASPHPIHIQSQKTHYGKLIEQMENDLSEERSIPKDSCWWMSNLGWMEELVWQSRHKTHWGKWWWAGKTIKAKRRKKSHASCAKRSNTIWTSVTKMKRPWGHQERKDRIWRSWILLSKILNLYDLVMQHRKGYSGLEGRPEGLWYSMVPPRWHFKYPVTAQCIEETQGDLCQFSRYWFCSPQCRWY